MVTGGLGCTRRKAKSGKRRMSGSRVNAHRLVWSNYAVVDAVRARFNSQVSSCLNTINMRHLHEEDRSVRRVGSFTGAERSLREFIAI